MSACAPLESLDRQCDVAIGEAGAGGIYGAERGGRVVACSRLSIPERGGRMSSRRSAISTHIHRHGKRPRLRGGTCDRIGANDPVRVLKHWVSAADIDRLALAPGADGSWLPREIFTASNTGTQGPVRAGEVPRGRQRLGQTRQLRGRRTGHRQAAQLAPPAVRA